MDKVSGKLFVRDVGESRDITKDGRILLMVCGIWAVPPNVLQGESLYTIGGLVGPGDSGIDLRLFPHSRLDISHTSRGNTPSDLLCSLIWQV